MGSYLKKIKKINLTFVKFKGFNLKITSVDKSVH